MADFTAPGVPTMRQRGAPSGLASAVPTMRQRHAVAGLAALLTDQAGQVLTDQSGQALLARAMTAQRPAPPAPALKVKRP